ncbi:hypothetical protein VYU27_009154, partial [Nannochloropsis oceanica]
SRGITSSNSRNSNANDRIKASATLYHQEHPPPSRPQPPFVLFDYTKGENCQTLKRLFRRLRKAGVHVEMYVTGREEMGK